MLGFLRLQFRPALDVLAHRKTPEVLQDRAVYFPEPGRRMVRKGQP